MLVPLKNSCAPDKMLVPRLVPQVEIAKRNGYHVIHLGGDIYDVANKRLPDKPHFEVNMADPKCCTHVRNHQQPCRHMCAVFAYQSAFEGSRAIRNTLTQFWPKCFHAQYYLELHTQYGRVRVPEAYGGAFEGDETDKLLPPVQTHKPPGRPKKKRYRYKKQTPHTVAQVLPDVLAPEYETMIQFI